LGIHLNSGSYPVGKTDALTLRPMSFTEFLEAAVEEQLVENFDQVDSHFKIPARLVYGLYPISTSF
jgi:hypothetical protein